MYRRLVPARPIHYAGPFRKGSPMLHIVATLHAFGLRVTDRARARLAVAPERGNVTIENVLWAVAVIAIVAIVVAAIRAFVTSEAAKIG